MNSMHKVHSTLALLTVLVGLLFSPLTWAEINFPELKSQVVDQANMLSAEQVSQITAKLEALEASSTNQIVVVTLPDLQGYTIERFALELGRHWQIGQKDKDNGALLVVAAEEKKIRIEVGYGLEGFLTDATSQSIIYNEIRPAFKAADFGLGITQGVDAMIGAIDGSYTPPEKNNDTSLLEGYLPLFFIGIVGFAELIKRKLSSKAGSGIAFGGIIGLMVTVASQSLLFGGLAGLAGFLFVSLTGSSSGGSGGSHYGGYNGGRTGGFGGGGGFSGGGGGFGGGGASGGW